MSDGSFPITHHNSERPVIFVVDDDPDSLAIIDRDLRNRFGRDFQIVTAGSPKEGLASLERLAVSLARVAIIAADLLMSEMDGAQFLEQGCSFHREAKRVLLVTMNRRGIFPESDGWPILQSAMALGQADYSIAKDWVTPEEWFFPQIQEALGAWAGNNLPHKEIVRVVGDQWDPATHTLRETLARNVVPTGFYESNSPEGRDLLQSIGASDASLPVAIFQDGFYLSNPEPLEVAEALGAPTSPGDTLYDVVILGAGPAGLAAAVYAASEGLEALVVEPKALGGQAGTSSMIRNYLGFPRGLSGTDLTARGYEQALLFGARFLFMQDAVGLSVHKDHYQIDLSACDPARARSLIVAIGMEYRRLQIPELERLVGAGVYYGSATVEAPGMLGKDVAVVGGANSAGQAAIYLARFADRVTMLVRSDSLELSMSSYLIDQIEATPNIEVLFRTQVVGASGDSRLASLAIENSINGEVRELRVSAVFILIGAVSCAGRLSGILEMDQWGYIMTGRDLSLDSWPLSRQPHSFETSVPGVFAVGDVRHRSVRRVAGAAGEGSVAVSSVHRWLAEEESRFRAT